MTSLSVKSAQAAKSKKIKPRVKRILEKRAPKVNENVKNAIFLHGEKSSQVINDLLRDLSVMKKPFSVLFTKKNKIYPFEDVSSLEYFSQKKDASLFVFGSHSKKRPHNVVIGRCFDYQVIDLLELGITNFKPMSEFKSKKQGVGMKPCFIFQGEPFQQNDDYKKLANVLIDMYRGHVLEEINLAGLEHVIICTAVAGVVHFRHYSILLKKSGTKFPRVELEEIGPSFDITIRRTKTASHDLMKAALQVPNELKKKKQKNISTNVFGQKLIRVHMSDQKLDSIQTRKVKGLKKRKLESDNGQGSEKKARN